MIPAPWYGLLLGLSISIIILAISLSNIEEICDCGEMPIEDKQILDSFIGLESKENKMNNEGLLLPALSMILVYK